jgi:hypothetical protein
VTRNFLIERYSFFEKNPTTILLIKSLSKLSKESLHLFTDFSLSSVNKRIFFLRTIKQKRNEGYSIVYLDETWVDTHHTASHQWTPPNPSDARKIPLNKGQRFVITMVRRIVHYNKTFRWKCGK